MSTSTSIQRDPISLTGTTRRPDKGGSLGTPIKVRTNFFAIKKLPVNTIYHYDVQITPQVPASKARQVWKVVEETAKEIPKNKVVYDGRANAYAAEELAIPNALTLKLELPDEGVTKSAPASSTRKKNEFTIKIVFAAKIELEELHRFIRREGPVTPSCHTAVQALNIVMTHKVFSENVSHGRSIYTPNNAQNLGGGFERWDGVFQSIRPGQGQMFANIDIASTVFIKGGNAAGLMAEVLRARAPDDLVRGISPQNIQTLKKHFKRCAFTVNHRGDGFKKKFKVSDISPSSADATTFQQELNDGTKKKMSISQYYSSVYNVKLRFPFLPCIGVHGREGQTMYFPPELCNIVPGMRYSKKLNPDQTAEMIKGACVKPQDRIKKIDQAFPLLGLDQNQYLKAFNLEVNTKMTEVPARVLPAPPIQYANNVTAIPQFGGWQMNPSRKMYQGATLKSWGVLVYENERRLGRPAVQNFIRELTSTLGENGMTVQCKEPPIVYAQIGQVERNVDDVWKEIEKACKAPPQILLVVLPSVCPTYSAIKTYCETSKDGRMTQCVLSNKIQRMNKQYCGMLGLKINTKLGGVNSVLKMGHIPFLTDAPTMIFGADVTHPSPGEVRPSVVAVVGSLDPHGARYAGRTKVQDSGVEVIDGLKYLVYELLVAFHAKNKMYPKRILFYRDGVSEGQYAEVVRTEVAAVKEACAHINDQYKPNVTFCVVKKRHHARLFPITPKDQDKSGNCVAGTVVDSVITHPTEFDFYLQSHGGLQGTSRPTLYHVLLDENKFSSDRLQTLTYNLCHLYSRCPKSVSIVPSVYYAHLLAYRARHYQGDDFSDTASSVSGGGNVTEQTFKTSADMKNLMYFV